MTTQRLVRLEERVRKLSAKLKELAKDHKRAMLGFSRRLTKELAEIRDEEYW
jgi:hypothetical protein